MEVVAHANAASTWLFLINHGGEQLNGKQRWARRSRRSPPYPVTLQVRDPQGRRRKP